MTYVIDGDFTYDKVMMKSLDGSRKQDITNQCVTMDIYESILSPIIKAELVIYDSIDLLQTFPIKGEELVEIDWKSHSKNKSTFTKLIVVSVQDIGIDVSNRMKSYKLLLTSPELYYSQRNLVKKHYKQNSSDIIKDIVKTKLQTSKKIQNDSTKGIEDITLTKLKPFQAIDLLRRRAISTKNKSSSFVFYENQYGYQFRTLESIFEQGKKNVGDRIYFYDTNTAESVRTVNYRNIIAYQHQNLATTLDSVQNGGLNNRVIELDLVTGEIKKHDFKDESYVKVDKSGTDISTSTFKQKYGEEPSVQYFVASDSSLPDYQLPEKIGYLQGFIQKIVSNLLHVHVYGDNLTGAGDVIELKIPDATGLTNTKEGKMMSGNYMIAKCRHMLTFGNYRQYTQSFELIKGSYLGK
jgi:hypothetical protein